MSDAFNAPTGQGVDLTNCDREPIHIPGHVQPFGCLIGVSADWIVTHASLNLREWFEMDAREIIGRPLADMFCDKSIARMRSRLQLLQEDDSERLFNVPLCRSGSDDVETRRYDLALHRSGDTIVIEIEAVPDNGEDTYVQHVRPLIGRIEDSETVEDLCRKAARHLRALTGFDRIMVYRFARDGSGEVVSEARRGGLESYLGLHYPASDIPRQARDLYKRNLLRIISDVDAIVSPIHPACGPDGSPLDLSLSTLRAVSPIHLEYLRNMGVKASMSVSILVRGKLWGLFACHHYDPLVLSFQVRSACELFGQLFALVLDQKESDLERDQQARAKRLHDRLMAQLADGASLSKNFDMIAEMLDNIIEYDGVVGWIDGEFHAEGTTPTQEEFAGLARFLNTTAVSRVFATEHLAAIYKPAEDFIERAAGLLALPVSRTPRDYIVLFRREVARTVKWAGNPEKAMETGPNGVRLTPRKSFEAWQEVVHGRSAEWSDAELTIAESLRVTLLEVVLRLTEAMMKERLRANDHQELLIAELNHRVRNILSLIRGLVTQSGTEAASIDEFTRIVGDRIHALSLAHDQLTGGKWGPSSLRNLIETEVDAYVTGGRDGRVIIDGPDVLVEPRAFVTLSLVMHEMMTNSVKYGALCARGGRIYVTLSEEADGRLGIDWRESGGPAVQPPKRRGFGSTVIEQSIPFELGGEAEIHYEMLGVRARFRLPPACVAEFIEPRAQVDSRGETSATASVPASGRDAGRAYSDPFRVRSALILEDNMIIALDMEDILGELGVETVYVAPGKNEARRLVAENDIDLFILDVNLGDETSEDFAADLVAAGKPFLFATGYGEAENLKEKFPATRVLQKPFDYHTLRQTLQELGVRVKGA